MSAQIDITSSGQGIALLDLVDVGMLVIENQQIAFANTAFVKAVGRPLSELCSQPLKEVAGQAWVDLTLGQSWADALPWPMPDGGVRWFEATQHETTNEGRPVLVVTCLDVTSRMRAEGAEANMLQMLTEIIEGYPVGTYVIDSDHMITHWNRACELLTGTSAAEVVGTDEAWRAFGIPQRPLLADWVMGNMGSDEAELRRIYKDRFWRSSVGNDTYEAEAFFPTLGRNGRWLHFAASPLRSADGDIVGAVETLVDITERMEMEQLLREAIGGAPVGVFIVDIDHRITHWNRVCEALTHIPAQHILGKTEAWKAFYGEPQAVLADMIVDGADEHEIRRRYPAGTCRRSATVEGAFQMEAFFPRVGSSGSWLQTTAAPLRNADGRIVGAIETVIDITARKYAEEELRTAHMAAERLVAERTGELLTAKAELEEDVVRRQLAQKELARRLEELTALNTTLSETQDRLLRSQQQLTQSEKLASIGQLAAGVAHEINNPIGYVFSNFGTLQGYLGDLITLIEAFEAAEPSIVADDLRARIAALRKEIDLEYLKGDILDLMRESREGIERVRKIVQDLKDFSHVDASSDWQWADLHRGLESTLNIAHNEIKYRADVVREFGVLPPVECLPSQLNQVFMNLLVNAAHAMDGKARGTIRVITGTEGENVWIEVQDNGSGIPPDVINRIFDPFFTTKAVGKGTGLGLSLSYGIIQKHHGQIGVTSQPGEGTTFRIQLPIRQPAPPAKDNN